MATLNTQRWGSNPSRILVFPVHARVRGRVRLKVPSLYRAPDMGARLTDAIQRQPAVRIAQVNTLTGNLLLVHDEALLVDEVINLVRQVVEHVLYAPVSEENEVRHVALDEIPAASSSDSSWHVLAPSVCLTRCETTADAGLSASAAAARLAQWGRNALPQPPPRSALALFLEQFKTLPVAMLGVSAVVSVATGGIADAAIILAVVLINAVIGYITESQAERIIGALDVTPHHRVRVVRDGWVSEVEPETVVVGDILVLAPGEVVAADGRLIEVQGLSVDEAALTGESMPVNKATTPLARQDVPLGDRTNMVYMGTTVTGGSGRVVVIATGLSTEIGRVHTLLGSATTPETPMKRQLSDMGRQLVIGSGAICGVVFVIGMLRGYGLVQMLKTSISLAVAALPEGLPTVATTTLALGIRDMRRHGVLIRHLAAVETLGSVQVMCMDKTGTLTINRMSAVLLRAGTTMVTVSHRGFLRGDQSPVEPLTHPDLGPLLQVAVLCNDTELVGEGDHCSLHGSATENALIALALAAGMDVAALRAQRPRIRVQYRTETRRYMVTEHLMPDGHPWLAVKGSPAELLALCRWYLKDGERYQLDEVSRTAIDTANVQAAGEALRMLGLAYGEAPEDNGALPHDLVWLGMVGMMDPIRQGVHDLIASFHQAGIATVMITGDQSATAYAIGRELNLGDGQSIEIFDSSRLDQVDDALLSALAQRVQVFARVSPAHKLKIVQALQRAGKVVAMTGDGINDSPALKAADIGVAMGGGGTQAARGVADVILEADDLQTMLLTVSRGRTIYSNIRKSIHYLLATNMSEIMVMTAAIATGMGHPLNPMQLLWINLMSDIFPGLALAVEPPEPDVLQRPPRDPKEPIVGWGDFKRLDFESGVLSAGALASYGYGRLRYGPGARANTLAFMTLTTAQILHALSCRSERNSLLRRDAMEPNPYLTLAVGGSVAVQTMAALVPGLRSFLGLTPLGLSDVLVVGGGAIGPLLINELTKGSAKPRRAGGGM